MTPRWILSSPLASASAAASDKRIWALAMIGAYVLISLVYGFLSDAPWDDDCIVRCFNARASWSEPAQFFSVWNRPLFMVLFAPAALIGREAMMVQMILLTAWGGWLLYQSLQRLGAQDAHWVLPFFFFQAFYFSISRNFLTEPLAVTVICIGLHALVHQRFVLFAVMGGLLPLARLELIAILPFWAVALLQAKHFKQIALMAVPLVVLMLLGYLVKDTDDPLWLVTDTLGKEGKNRYGSREVWHYFQRFAYVVGPVVFFFLVIGVLERLVRLRLDLFVFLQGIGILLLYVVFSTKLNMGNSAGFLRNLIPMSPFVAVLAYEGLMAWQGRAYTSSVASAAASAASHGHRKKSKAASRPQRIANPWWALGRVHLFGVVAVAVLWAYFSKKLESHHKISGITDHAPVLFGAALLIIGLAQLLVWRTRIAPRAVLATTALLASAGALGYALWTERPDAHLNPERKAISVLSTLYKDSYLREWPLYANHPWFFWPNDLGYPDKTRYRTLTKAALDTADAHSVVLWENHYSHRLQGDVQLADLYKRKDMVELAHVVSTDHRAIVGLFQKTGPNRNDAAELRQRFMSAHPDNIYAHFALNQEHSRARRFDEALAEARRMVALDSSFVEGIVAEGQALFDLARFQEAEACFQRILKIDKALYTIRYSIALCRFRQQDHAGAANAARQFLKHDKKSKEVHELLGAALFQQQKYDSAVIAFDAYIKLDAKSPNGWLNRASCRLQQQRWDGALTDLEQVLRREPANRGALLNKATALLSLNRREEGCQLLRQLAAAGDATAAQRLVLCAP
jgi:tetratricopeptide (TPR) repeat protein